MSAELEHIWSRVQAELASAVGEETYRIWLEPLRAGELTHGRLSIEAPVQACGWVRDRFGRILQACATSVLGDEVVVELIPSAAVHGGEPGIHTSPPDRLGGDSWSRGAGYSPERLPPHRASATSRVSAADPLPNPKLTFDQFVIGDGNRLAHAAALTVAEMPGQAYNPLFICGPPGVGKTHLLSSIADLLLAHNPGLAVRVTTGETFTNEFLGALSGRNTEAFKSRFRHIDVLLVDDVQFLERKTRTEEEFFHTFNALYDCGRQIVLSSDRPPRDLQALEDRLRERFGSGLVADVRPPDLATRMTILRKRAQHDDIDLTDEEPLRLIAERIHDNVRAIEGALIRVVAFGSLTGRALTPELTREVLDGLYPTAQSICHGPPSIRDITQAACQRFGLTPEELLSSSRISRISWPRQVAMYLARELTDESLPAIGRQFGGRDHTTVLHACRRTATRIADDASTRDVVDGLRRDLQTEGGTGAEFHHDRTA
ncbi:MAG TPA: chromosomal replication initiator protein DnaA [Solirubrobacteraceae bacterium]|nr:chromosomal replication initiator protein DnaA [Solirubrobacteraceae bacterium]